MQSNQEFFHLLSNLKGLCLEQVFIGALYATLNVNPLQDDKSTQLIFFEQYFFYWIQSSNQLLLKASLHSSDIPFQVKKEFKFDCSLTFFTSTNHVKDVRTFSTQRSRNQSIKSIFNASQNQHLSTIMLFIICKYNIFIYQHIKLNF